MTKKISKKKNKKMKQRRTLKKKNVKVGEVIGMGSYGCVINPSIILINTQDPYSIVSKLIENKYAEKELAILQDLQQIDPEGLYTSILSGFSPLTQEIILKQSRETQEDIKHCINRKSTQNISIINTTNIGLSLENHLKFIDKTQLTERERFIKNDIHNIKVNFREIVCNLLEGLNHFHKNNIIHRDIKPENIAFGKHIREYDFTFLNKNGKNVYLGRNINHYNFEFISKEVKNKTKYEYLCKYLDFGLSLNFSKDKREEIGRELQITGSRISKKELMTQEMIHTPDYIISTAEQADIFIQQLFSGTVMFMPVEHFAVLIKMIRKFPILLNKGLHTSYLITSTFIGNKPYTEKGIIDCLIESCMKPFGGAFKLDEYREINKIVDYLLSLEDLENYFFKYHIEEDGSVFLPFVFYQDYYALGLTLDTILNTLKIIDKPLGAIIKELYNISIFGRMDINLEDMIYRIRHL
jgi:serine/threonine protein kinase